MRVQRRFLNRSIIAKLDSRGRFVIREAWVHVRRSHLLQQLITRLRAMRDVQGSFRPCTYGPGITRLIWARPPRQTRSEFSHPRKRGNIRVPIRTLRARGPPNPNADRHVIVLDPAYAKCRKPNADSQSILR